MQRLTPSDILGWSRFVLAGLVVAVHAVWPESRVAIAAIIAVAALTDFFDGIVARRFKTVDRTGGILDYTADKFFFTLCFVVLLGRGEVGVVVTAVVFARDVAVSGMRLSMLLDGADLPARLLGKARTGLIFPTLFFAALGLPGTTALLAIVAAISVISLFDYGAVFLRHVRRATP